jgi:hypothetical protein
MFFSNLPRGKSPIPHLTYDYEAFDRDIIHILFLYNHKPIRREEAQQIDQMTSISH